MFIPDVFPRKIETIAYYTYTVRRRGQPPEEVTEELTCAIRWIAYQGYGLTDWQITVNGDPRIRVGDPRYYLSRNALAPLVANKLAEVLQWMYDNPEDINPQWLIDWVWLSIGLMAQAPKLPIPKDHPVREMRSRLQKALDEAGISFELKKTTFIEQLKGVPSGFYEVLASALSGEGGWLGRVFAIAWLAFALYGTAMIISGTALTPAQFLQWLIAHAKQGFSAVMLLSQAHKLMEGESEMLEQAQKFKAELVRKGIERQQQAEETKKTLLPLLLTVGAVIGVSTLS